MEKKGYIMYHTLIYELAVEVLQYPALFRVNEGMRKRRKFRAPLIFLFYFYSEVSMTDYYRIFLQNFLTQEDQALTPFAEYGRSKCCMVQL